MTYTPPSGEAELDGGCSFGRALCTWTGTSAHLWRPDAGWDALPPAPAALDSGFKLQSGLLVGAGTHVGFLPAGATDWAWWRNLSTFTDAHPMYGGLLLCPDANSDSYTLFSITEQGLEEQAHFEAHDLAQPLAGWSPPTNPDRLLLLGNDGLWALDPPYTPSALQPLVAFDDVELPALDDISGPFHSGAATVVIPRRSRTALRLDLSDGSGHATGLKHLAGDAALWTAYLRDDRATADRILTTLATLPPSQNSSLQLYDVLMHEDRVHAVSTSAGLFCPEAHPSPDLTATTDHLRTSPLDGAALATWGLWLEWDDAVATACRQLCTASDPDFALAESLRLFAGPDACRTLFDLLQSNPPSSPTSGEYDYPLEALRALAAPFGDEIASLVADHLSDAPAPARRAACAMAGALPTDAPSNAATSSESTPALWNEASSVPAEALRTNAHHGHPAVRAAARDTCRRLGIGYRPDDPSGPSPRFFQSSQPESPK
ncbi:hypothetical protein BSZ35_07265 [Salinibacter sp. 10B]|uniref:hypothetical protein n=1 Tax=Salinibacter sp. 10B TaxID=1923971 RepID=UPI000CF57B78|nr:hypothetical protein [Salinibacter sp. 10B]PQJ34426.1 hypothetical protein BSZ35_07265 [Salinibacter sp. 10B]